MLNPLERRAFDTSQYVTAQVERVRQKIAQYGSGPVYLEFGGKPFGDHHAARVLPGYHPDCKSVILSELGLLMKVVMVVNARDILPEPTGRYPRGRIRGDSRLRYGDETIRLIEESRGLGIPITDLVLSVTPRVARVEDTHSIEAFRETLTQHGVKLHQHFEVPGYPHPSILEKADQCFGRNDVVAEPGKHLVVFSPGGGSGKFGVMLSEIWHALQRNEVPNFLKFETFPVFGLPATHALNLAFEAATADLHNTCCTTQGTTTYDKDVENFALLQGIFRQIGSEGAHPVLAMSRPTDMGVNIIEKAVYDMQHVIEACGAEIVRRYSRYVIEYLAGDERLDTVVRAKEVLNRY